jgi:hypothetical protein
MRKTILALLELLWALPALAQSYAYSDNGLSFRAWNQPSNLAPGEVYFASPPTTAALEAAFPAGTAPNIGYDAAVAQQSELGVAANLGSAITIACASGATVCTGAITGTYSLAGQAQFFITAEAVSIAQNGTFTNGTGSKTWPDASNAIHSFSVPQWKEFDTAVAAYVDALNGAVLTIQSGGTPTMPSQTVPLN